MSVFRGTVFFDLDCCLYDFEGAFRNKWGSERRHMYDLKKRYPEAAQEIDAWIGSPETYRNLPVNVPALDFFFYLKAGIFERVCAWTSRPESSYYATCDSLARIGIDRADLVHDSVDKLSSQIIRAFNPVLVIDDNPIWLEAAKHRGIPFACWAQPWNMMWYPRYMADETGTIWLKATHRDQAKRILSPEVKQEDKKSFIPKV